MSEAWKYGVRNKHVMTFCMRFMEYLRNPELTPEEAIVELITDLEREDRSFPPESWHVVLKNLKVMIEDGLS
jgi:hypothetical protein